MYDEFTQERIANLRTQKDCSAREMSLSIGQNPNYIGKIENKKTLPSLPVLFYVCEFFGITPQEFFDEGNRYPERLQEIIEDIRKLNDKDLASLAGVVKAMVRNQ